MTLKINVESAGNPRFSNKDKTSIDLDVKFSHIDEVIPFTAMKGEDGYTGQLYDNAMKGKYGKVSEWVDNVTEFNVMVSKELQKKKIESASTLISVLSDKIEFFGADEDIETQIKKLKLYRISIMELDKDPSWPYVEFPDMP